MKHAEANGYQEISVGPVKIKDGLFMGDELAAKVIVTSMLGYRVHNKQQGHSRYQYSCSQDSQFVGEFLRSLLIRWMDWKINQCTHAETKIFDKKNNGVNAIYTFI